MRHTIIIVSLVAGLCTSAIGQNRPARSDERGAMRRGGTPGLSAETALGMRAQLELSDAQITTLRSMRRDAVARRTSTLTERLALRSELNAGEITRDEFAATMRTRREATRATTSEADIARGVLSEAQRDQLADIRRAKFRRSAMAQHGRAGRQGFGPHRAAPQRQFDRRDGRRLEPADRDRFDRRPLRRGRTNTRP